MLIVRNPFLPLRRFDAINLFGMLFCRRETIISEDLIRHERIHTKQMVETLFVGFYLWYLLEWLVRLPLQGNAYRQLLFEREAYAHMHDPDYLTHRRPYAFLCKEKVKE